MQGRGAAESQLDREGPRECICHVILCQPLSPPCFISQTQIHPSEIFESSDARAISTCKHTKKRSHGLINQEIQPDPLYLTTRYTNNRRRVDRQRTTFKISLRPLFGGSRISHFRISHSIASTRTLHRTAPARKDTTKMAATIQHDAAAGSVVVMEKVSVLGCPPSHKAPPSSWDYDGTM